MKVADELEMTKLVADEMDRIVAEQTRRIRELESALRELVAAHAHHSQLRVSQALDYAERVLRPK